MRRWTSAAAFGVLLLPAVAAAYTPVTDARLKSPEPENWLMLRGNYQGWMYSPLSQINTNNVKHLVPVWSYATGVDSGHEAPPIVNDGVMFVAAPYDKLMALDAKTGDLLWEYQRELPEGFGALHNTKRGVALYGDKVYMTGQDAVAGRARRQDRRGRLGERAGRRLAAGLLHDHGAADRERQGHGRGVRRRVRRARLHRGVRRRERQAGVEDLHRPRSGRARARHLGGRHLADGRRLDLDDRHLRSREQYRLLGHRQRLALVRRSAARRQSLHLVDGGDRSRQRQDQGPLPVPLERLLGLGRDERADGGRLREGRSGRQRADQAVAQRLPVLARALAGRPDRLRQRDQLRQAGRVREHRRQDRPADLQRRPQAGHRQVRRVLPVAVGRQGLAVRGLQPEHRHGLHPGQRQPLRLARRQGRRSSSPASGGPASPSRTSASRSTRTPSPTARSRRGTSTPARRSGPISIR